MDLEVIVIGGGAAGLSGGVVLARARRRVLVIDAGQQRNLPAAGMHSFLTRDGMPPGELVRRGTAELEGYGGSMHRGRVVDAVRAGDEFVVTVDDGSTHRARQLLVTTGLVDELPDVSGLAERWGNDVVHCPYCHGWEVRDRPIAVLATGPMSVHQALLFSQWSDDVTLVMHEQPVPDADELRRLGARTVAVVEGQAAKVVVEHDAITGLRLADDRIVPAEVIVIGTRLVARSELLENLGVEISDVRMGEAVMGTQAVADETGRTNVPGVWVAGNVSAGNAQVVMAAAAGVTAASMINMELIEADIAAALE